MKLEFEKATIENLNEILDLFKNTIKKSCSKDYNDAQILIWISSIEDKERWKNKIKNQYFIVVKSKNKIVGFGSLDKNYIDLLYVHKDFLRKGIASFTYEILKKESEKLGVKNLYTDSSKTALSFFKSKEFKIIKKNKIIKKGVEISNFEMTQKV